MRVLPLELQTVALMISNISSAENDDLKVARGQISLNKYFIVAAANCRPNDKHYKTS